LTNAFLSSALSEEGFRPHTRLMRARGPGRREGCDSTNAMSRQHGAAIIYQELSLLPKPNFADTICFGYQPQANGSINQEGQGEFPHLLTFRAAVEP